MLMTVDHIVITIVVNRLHFMRIVDKQNFLAVVIPRHGFTDKIESVIYVPRIRLAIMVTDHQNFSTIKNADNFGDLIARPLCVDNIPDIDNHIIGRNHLIPTVDHRLVHVDNILKASVTKIVDVPMIKMIIGNNEYVRLWFHCSDLSLDNV